MIFGSSLPYVLPSPLSGLEECSAGGYEMYDDRGLARAEEQAVAEQRDGRCPVGEETVQQMGRPDHQSRARSSPPASSTRRDVRTEIWLEQHKEQLRGGQFPPGFSRAPLSSGLHHQQHLRPHHHHPRSGSYGGNSRSHTRHSSPSQWSMSQYSHSQCVTPRSGAGGSIFNPAKGQHLGGLSSSLPRSHHGADHSSGYRQMGAATPPALQITSPVTPRDFSSGYNSPRASEDLQRHASDEFVYGEQLRQRGRERERGAGRRRGRPAFPPARAPARASTPAGAAGPPGRTSSSPAANRRGPQGRWQDVGGYATLRMAGERLPDLCGESGD